MGVDVRVGADVCTADGHKFGKVAAIVLSPDGRQATHLVVRRGLLFVEDFLVLADEVTAVTDHDVRLAITKEEVEERPDLDIADAMPLETGRRDVAGHGPPEPPNIWPGTPAVTLPPLVTFSSTIHPYVLEEWRTVPPDSIVLREDLPVRARDGRYLGTVAELVVEPETRRTTHLVVRLEGFVTHHLKAIPMDWVERSDEDYGVTLAVDRDAVMALPDHHG